MLKKDIKDIALSSPKLAFQYYSLGGELTPEIKNKIKESSYYTYEYFEYYNLDKEMYSGINNVRDITLLLTNGFSVKKDFFKAILKQDYLVYNNVDSLNTFKDCLTKYKEKHREYANEVDKILLKEFKY